MIDSHEIGQIYYLSGLSVIIVGYEHNAWIIALEKNLDGIPVQFPFVPIAERYLLNFTEFALKRKKIIVSSQEQSLAKSISSWEQVGHAHFALDVEAIWDLATQIFELTPEYLEGIDSNCKLLMPIIFPAIAADVDPNQFVSFNVNIGKEIGGNA